MEPANKAIEVWREGIDFRRIGIQGVNVSTRCLQLSDQFSDCVLSKGLNLLDHQSVRNNCSVDEWKKECAGITRRHQFQKLYRKTVNRRLYTQNQLDKYMESKNNIQHFGLIDHRY